jgi:endonuclease/exonuclease/phosphatase family metal-dependent hydrolase
MNYYYLNALSEQPLFIEDKTDRNAVIDNIIELRKHLSDKDHGIPEKKLTGNLILGTWNLRELGNTKYGGRMAESLYYIAEIISRFDLIAIQEVRDQLGDFNKVCRILGNDWGIFTSVVTQGGSGNRERLAFLYDKRTVSFRNIAGQVILPPSEDTEQLARSPYIVRFQSGWLKFDICTTHIYYGKDSKSSPEYQRRVDEIGKLTAYLKKYYIEKKEAYNMFLLGDFNIENRESRTYEAATSSAFKIPDALLEKNLYTNSKQDKMYDQILYYNEFADITFKNAGAFDFYKTVFDKKENFAARIKKHQDKEIDTDKAFNDFKTYQMSDHLPLWVEMNTDHTESYLKMIKDKK